VFPSHEVNIIIEQRLNTERDALPQSAQ